MNKEQQMFLKIISDHLQGRKTVPPEDLDWPQIIRYAKSHQIEGIISHQVHDCFDHKNEHIDIAGQMKNAKLACVFAYAANTHAFDEIRHAFRTDNIRFFPVKGLEIASCYPIPEYRTMSDLDIVAFSKDKEKASKILEGLGYTLLEKNYGIQFRKHIIKLELDDHLLHKESLENDNRRLFFDTCWKYINTDPKGGFQLDNGFHYLYLLEHTKKHFRTRGIGFRQFIDLAVFVQKHSDLDWEWIKTQLHKIDLWKFAVLAHAFINKWWGIESPYEAETLENTFFEETTEYVFNSGVFGFDNINCSLYVAEAEMNSDRHPQLLIPLNIFFKKTFISYEQMIRLPYCSFIAGKKWLLPVGWIYHAVYIATNRKGHLKKNKVSNESQEIMDNHRKLMEKWGI